MNIINKLIFERIFCVLFGLAIMIVGLISPRCAMINLWTTFQRIQFDNKEKK